MAAFDAVFVGLTILDIAGRPVLGIPPRGGVAFIEQIRLNRLGRVSIAGTLGGVLFLAIIDNGLNLMGLNYLVKDALVGVILVVALALSFWQARLRQTHR